ncbi:MAG: hypothetical protein J5802_05250 [Butyrivibrio sp.]|nr:hypothetical protein [Butyrivibrio sp.]
MRRSISCLAIVLIFFSQIFITGFAQNNTGDVDGIVSRMSMDEKISQMIIPAVRTWNGQNMTDLNAVPELKEILRRHQYGGIILFGTNITGTEQVTRLVNNLQDNNMQIDNVSSHIPYLTAVDEEGGKVIRLNTGTRMTGNMAIGATANAAQNAQDTGLIIGKELSAVGFNADFAPNIDVNNNPANPVIGTRSFSDDPGLVAKLGVSYAKGLSNSNVIATYKHYPGHGDTGIDSHIGTPSVAKTYDELMKTELVPFKNAINSGADMIMTAHITYPKIDEEVVLGDGKTKGFFPATMSKKMVTGILRGDLGFNGVVVTDSLEMEAIRKAKLVPGAENSTEYRVNIAVQVINAGVDMLLIPTDLNGSSVAKFYDDYIAGIAAKVESGEISQKRIDESVKRILKLKAKHGIFNMTGNKADFGNVEERVANSKKVVGCAAHHEKEKKIARDAVTVVKNDSDLLPISRNAGKVKLLENAEKDAVDSSAEVVIGFSFASGNGDLDKNNTQRAALKKAIEQTHKNGGKFVLVSTNLPYDAAFYQDADAIVLAYLGYGSAIDPTGEKATNTSSANANIVAAIDTIYGDNKPTGRLPVNVPKVTQQADGSLKYGAEYLYKRGFGLTYK